MADNFKDVDAPQEERKEERVWDPAKNASDPKTITGWFTERKIGVGKLRDKNIYKVRSNELGDVMIWGKTLLDKQMKDNPKCPVGAYIRIVYEGLIPKSEKVPRPFHKFKVAVDETKGLYQAPPKAEPAKGMVPNAGFFTPTADDLPF